MILAIRIHGMTNMKYKIEETLFRMRLRKKLAAVLVDEKDEIEMGMLKGVKEFVTYGKISTEEIKKLVLKRGETLQGKKIAEKDVDKIVKEIEDGNWKIKKFFRLHPPVKGFRKSTKEMAPRGILGENKNISELLGRML